MSDFIPIEPPPGGMPYAVPFLGFNIERVPTLAVDLFQLAEWSQNLEDVRSLLELITDEVMIPSVHENFLAGGRPPWEPLSEYTLAQKQGNSILIETGNLLDVATAQSTWVIDAAEGEVIAFRCTGKRFLPLFLASFVVPSLALKLRRE